MSRHLLAEDATDTANWQTAAAGGYTIVSKDNDFRQRSFVHGAPPKVVWLAVGNAGTRAVITLLRLNVHSLLQFDANPEESLLVLQ